MKSIENEMAPVTAENQYRFMHATGEGITNSKADVPERGHH